MQQRLLQDSQPRKVGQCGRDQEGVPEPGLEISPGQEQGTGCGSGIQRNCRGVRRVERPRQEMLVRLWRGWGKRGLGLVLQQQFSVRIR